MKVWVIGIALCVLRSTEGLLLSQSPSLLIRRNHFRHALLKQPSQSNSCFSRTTSSFGRGGAVDGSLLLATQRDDDASTVPEGTAAQPPRLAYALLWVSLLVYAFGIAPGGSPEAAAIDSTIIAKMISTPYDGTMNPIFVAIFNALGIVPAVLASLLLPGSGRLQGSNGPSQRLPALPFVIGSFALGFFGVGPYLGLRNINDDVTVDTRGTGSGLFEFKGTSVALLGFGLYLLYYAVTNSTGASFADFQQLFGQQRLVHVSTIDLTILSLAMWDPLSEDIRRRYKDPKESLPAWVYCLLPVIGPVVYLIVRPPLPTPPPSVE